MTKGEIVRIREDSDFGFSTRVRLLPGSRDADEDSGLVKLDVSLCSDDCVVGTRMYEPGCTGGEPFFVANNSAADEDDSYLVTYVYNEINQESKFLVMDAKSPILEIVAAVKLPGRVPDGLHGLFVTENCLSQ
ncbi:hypothetical protein MIMGU_mgv1a023420mg [Erythranthe guttata]|uniref:Uncharacterized protein n=1 Tax=Erythranthe guttata TaxID=4155 RepID=A0A022QA31_ERYGU|nr:hypothetical protein MIMGU_mgv1a023420mg [Erythranthe guttata]